MNDLQADAGRFTEDIDDQGVFTDKQTANYRYDRIGNLSKDVSEGIDTIIWNVSGKIKEIQFNNGKPNLSFIYDATGQRIAKLVHSTTDDAKIEKGDIYWRDAQGNPLSTEQYTTLWQDEEEQPTYAPLSQLKGLEYSVYGSSRLGVRSDTIAAGQIADLISIRGWRQYELSNHLGNVQATVADFIQGDEDNNQEVPLYSSQDYYAFGMQMPGRSYTFTGNSSLNKYRFGFGGQEQDNEIYGAGNSYTAEFWQYDPRLGRRWNVDPVYKYYLSNYSTFGNNPIVFIDPNGDDWYSSEDGKNVIWEEGSDPTKTIKGIEYSNIGENFTKVSNTGNTTTISHYEQNQLKSITLIEHSSIVIPPISLGTDNNRPSLGASNLSSTTSNSSSTAIAAAELVFQGSSIYYDNTDPAMGKYLNRMGVLYDAMKIGSAQLQVWDAEAKMAKAISTSEYQLHKQQYDEAVSKKWSNIGSAAFGFFAATPAMAYGVLDFMANETSLGRQQQAQLAYYEMQKWYNKPNKSTYQRKQYEYWKGQYEKYRTK